MWLLAWLVWASTAPRALAQAAPSDEPPGVIEGRRLANFVHDEMNVALVELQTPRFAIFTDWPRGEHRFLRTSLEQAYAGMARQFVPRGQDNVFEGKLPVFMFERRETFTRFASEVDELPVADSAAGYYADFGNGRGHLVMWRPDPQSHGGDVEAARRAWARTLVHEFAHAFLARWKGHRPLPRWVNEGIAELVSEQRFATQNYLDRARWIAASDWDLAPLFDDDAYPPGEAYPALMTMTLMLAEADPRRFVQMLESMKAGEPPEAALSASFGLDYGGLLARWKEWVAARASLQNPHAR